MPVPKITLPANMSPKQLATTIVQAQKAGHPNAPAILKALATTEATSRAAIKVKQPISPGALTATLTATAVRALQPGATPAKVIAAVKKVTATAKPPPRAVPIKRAAAPAPHVASRVRGDDSMGSGTNQSNQWIIKAMNSDALKIADVVATASRNPSFNTQAFLAAAQARTKDCDSKMFPLLMALTAAQYLQDPNLTRFVNSIYSNGCYAKDILDIADDPKWPSWTPGFFGAPVRAQIWAAAIPPGQAVPPQGSTVTYVGQSDAANQWIIHLQNNANQEQIASAIATASGDPTFSTQAFLQAAITAGQSIQGANNNNQVVMLLTGLAAVANLTDPALTQFINLIYPNGALASDILAIANGPGWPTFAPGAFGPAAQTAIWGAGIAAPLNAVIPGSGTDLADALNASGAAAPGTTAATTPGSPGYNPVADPNSPQYNPYSIPGNQWYNPALDPNSPSYNPVWDPTSQSYNPSDPSYNPANDPNSQSYVAPPPSPSMAAGSPAPAYTPTPAKKPKWWEMKRWSNFFFGL